MTKSEDFFKENLENAEEIRKKIIESTDYETKEIIERAIKEASRIVSEIKVTAADEEKKRFLESDRQINLLKDKIFSAVNLEKKKIVLNAKGKFIDEVFCEIKKQAEDFRNSEEYEKFLKKEVLESAKVIGVSELDIFYSYIDEKMMNEKFIKEITDFCRIKFNKDFSLQFIKDSFNDIGLLVQSKDGRLIYDNRFLSRLKRSYDEIYMDLLKKL